MKTRLQEFLTGGRDIFPLVVGAAPFGILFGTLAQSSGLSFWGAMGFSAIVFAGAAQFVALGLLAVGTAVPLIILTTFVVNLRHLLYSASLVPYVRQLPTGWKLLIAFLLTDESYAASIGRYRQSEASLYKHWHYLGGSLFMYLNWQLWTLVGLTLGQALPDTSRWGLDFAMVATFIGMVVPYVTRSAMLATVAVSGIVSAATFGWPHRLGLIFAAIAGMIAGYLTDQRQERRS
ncbi:MAG: AzlC family ABC transporter permease [Leptolyngbya sp. SIO4C1]|nr:AzlC family ABC transporter permease [Leptolyngbya sp. SIO4C1]